MSVATSPKDEQDDSDEETKGNGTLVPLSEATKAFLKTAFSSEMTNSNHRKEVEKFRIPECNFVRCLKLDPMFKSTVMCHYM